MPPLPFRRARPLALAALCALVVSACDPPDDGSPRVLVIGEAPRLVDPTAQPLREGDGLLLSNVAQGLVRFDSGGQIEAGLAERWNVSDDGLSYIFRLASAEWPGGGRVTAHQVARILRRASASGSANPLRDTLGAVEDIVAMTDRVIEVRLAAPRPNLLQLLAQPEFAIVRDRAGTGPFEAAPEPGPDGEMRLRRNLPIPDSDEERVEEVLLGHATVADALRSFAAGDADLVLGGGFGDLATARAARLPRGTLRFDPVAGLFGLVPARADGPVAEPEVRQLLSQAIDRATLLELLNVPGLTSRTTLLEPSLEGVPDPVQPAWSAAPLADRRAALVAESDRLFGAEEKPVLRVFLGAESPGSNRLLALLARDWGALGLTVERAERRRGADLALVDLVAPSTSPAWFLRQFRCATTPVCDPAADALLDGARQAPIPAQRAALLAEASRLMDDRTLFIPLAAPVRWSLVGQRIQNFAGNRFARHTLTGLEQAPARGSN